MPTIRAFLKKNFPFVANLLRSIKDFPLGFISSLNTAKIRKSDAGISVLYLTSNYPDRPATRREYAHGGAVKMTYLAEAFPHSFPSANLAYAVSSVGHPFGGRILRSLREKGIKIIVNQNGVAYHAWHGPGWEETNQKMKAMLDQAHYIIYQSQFCKLGAEHFLSPPNVPYEIIFNPVDTKLFTPSKKSIKDKSLTLLLGGNQRESYRLALALQTLKSLNDSSINAKLMVTGSLWHPEEDAKEQVREMLKNLRLEDKVIFTGTYSQEQAPTIFSQAHILLHTQYNDASPGLVLEAMASGLPVVYIKSGGVPELVGNAGEGVPTMPSWKEIKLPDPELLSQAVIAVMEDYKRYAEAARQRAVESFSLEKFIQAHRRIFEKALDS